MQSLFRRSLTTTLFALRDYQEECLASCLRAFHEEKIYRQAVSLPVGSGKTMIFSNLISRLQPPHLTATKSLVLAHREELLDQAARMINRVNPGLRVVIEQGKSKADPSTADVIVASVPTLGRRDSRRLEKYDPNQFKCVIVDEAHHAAADSYLRILQHFNLLVPNPRLLLWGCSATLSRYDDLPLGRVFDKVVYHIDLMRVMRAGHLCPLKTVQVDTDLVIGDGTGVVTGSDTTTEHAQIAIRNGDYDPHQLSLAIDTPKRNQMVVDTWHRVAHCEHQRHSTIVFGLNVRHVEGMAHLFTKLPGNIRPAVITGDTIDTVRRDILDQYQAGLINVLLNCAVLTEGTDLPRTDCVLLTRPTCNANLYVQMVGRGLRKHPNKQYCLLLDVVDRWTNNSRSLVTFPSLLPRYSSLSGDHDVELQEEIMQKLSKKEHTDALVSRLKVRLSAGGCDRIVDLRGHRISWIVIDGRTFLSADGRGMEAVLRVDESGSFATVDLHTDRHRSTQLSPPGTRLHDALESLCLHLHHSKRLDRFTKDALWRRHPITAAQLRYVAQIATGLGAPDHVYKELCRWTVGQASDFISRHVWMRRQGIDVGDVSELMEMMERPSVCLIRAPRRV